MPAQEITVLIVDDDQLHLTLYSWILQSHGYQCKSALVKSTSVDFPTEANVDLVLMDYRLSSSLTAVDVLLMVKKQFASAPVVVLSELQWMPDDMKGHAVAFVNKGDPKRLVETIDSILQSKPNVP